VTRKTKRVGGDVRETKHSERRAKNKSTKTGTEGKDHREQMRGKLTMREKRMNPECKKKKFDREAEEESEEVKAVGRSQGKGVYGLSGPVKKTLTQKQVETVGKKTEKINSIITTDKPGKTVGLQKDKEGRSKKKKIPRGEGHY